MKKRREVMRRLEKMEACVQSLSQINDLWFEHAQLMRAMINSAGEYKIVESEVEKIFWLDKGYIQHSVFDLARMSQSLPLSLCSYKFNYYVLKKST